MSITINGVSCTFALSEDGAGFGLNESWPDSGPRATVYYKCNWTDRYTVMRGLRGGYYLGSFYLPHAYPYSSNLCCLGVGQLIQIKPRINADGLLAYQEVIIPAEYGIPSWDLTPSDAGDLQKDPSGLSFTKTRARVSADVFLPPTGAYYWEAGPDNTKKVQDSQIGIIRPRIEFSVTRIALPYMPINKALTYVGSVNLAPVKLGDYTFPKGCLLFAGMNAGDGDEDQAKFSLSGKTFEIEYVFVGNGYVDDGTGGGVLIQPTWNQYMGTNGNWYSIGTKSDGTGSKPYRYTSFWTALP